MVSPTISSPTKVPPLSYADHAKKAQNIKSPISPQLNRTPVQSLSTTSGTLAPFSSPPLKPVAPPLALDLDSDPALNVVTLTDHHSPSASNVKTINGDTRANNDLASKALSVVAAHTSSQKSPVLNVWNVRKEQLAAARAALTEALAKELPPEPQALLPSSDSALPQNTVPSIAAFNSPTAPAPNSSHGPSALLNGVTSEDHDPFTVRTTIRSTRPLPPPVDDTDNWPEVGKAPTSTHSTANPSVTHPDDSAVRNGSEGDQIPTTIISRKSASLFLSILSDVLAVVSLSLLLRYILLPTVFTNYDVFLLPSIEITGEKTKWVPIPPKELQATADALAKPTKRQNRRDTYHTNHSRLGPRSGTHTAAGSASGSAQSQSRGHSASQSTSHSRVQSRSESLQSSPSIARERPLPADDGSGVSGQGAMNHMTASWSSRASSPPLAVRHLRSAIDPNISLSNKTRPGPSYNQVGIQTSDNPSSAHLHYSTQPTQQYYYYPNAHVPMPPQQNGYPIQSGTPPVPYPNSGAPYSITASYAAYDYHNSAPHYGYWDTSQSHPGSGTHSPVYPPLQAGLPYYLTHFALTYPQQHPPPPRSVQSSTGVRPRLSPLEQSQAVAGYKEVAIGKESPVVFGSIGTPGASQSPSPAPLPSGKINWRDGVAERGEDKEEDEKAFTKFSIGVTPGDGPSRLRGRTASHKSRTTTVSTSGTESEVKTEDETEESVPASTESKIIDLTDSQELKWEFGTATSSLREDRSVHSLPISSDNPHDDIEVLHETLPPVLPSITGFGVHSGTVYRSTSRSPPGGVQSDAIPPIVEGALLPARLRDVAAGDDFEVKDFGYGFGPASGTGRAPVITREEREAREREHRREREREKTEKEKMERELQRDPAELNDQDQEKERFRDMDVPVRPRRGGHSGYDRGERSGRRGRGMNGFGRGYPTRRGGFQQHSPQQQQHRQPFAVTPPQALFQPLQAVCEPSNGYYPQPQPSYIPPGYEAYLPPTTNPTASHISPPVPVPVTTISFPLDPTRWYLLGQLEYYLSPQNMAQDFFLRQQVTLFFLSHPCLTASSESTLHHRWTRRDGYPFP